MKSLISEYFISDRIYLRLLNDDNRDKLFVEVNQPELVNKIFNPLINLGANSHRFFYKRFAILGDFRIGKTELGKYIIFKMRKQYSPENLISITINSERAQYKNIEEIDNWLYEQWLLQLKQVENPKFKENVFKILNNFEKERGYSHRDIKKDNYIDKLNLICEIYKEYKKINKKAKYIVEFDQANVIYKNEKDFIPFHQFWRNFQGFWENEKYFANLKILIFVIGHKRWEEFATLREPGGRGVFDILVPYDYWTNEDIYQMFKKRFEYALNPEYKDELKYFLPPGIVDFFRNKLGKINTVEYLDALFGENGYLIKFMRDFRKNKSKNENFLKFCEKYHQIEERDDTYYQDVERHFIKDTSSDYMNVFRYLSDNQDEPWFDEFFSLIDLIYDKGNIVFGSRLFNRNFEALEKDLISLKFSYNQKDNVIPEFTPPIFVDYNNDLTLDRQFREILSVISPDKRSSSRSIRLRKFIESKRIRKKDFLESKNGKEMKVLIKENQEISEDIFRIVQRWILNRYFGVIGEEKRITNDYLTPFWHIRDVLFRISQNYKGNSTNWALFDNDVRELSTFIIEESFPKNSPFLNYVDLSELSPKLISPTTSNIRLIKILNSILSNFLRKIKIFGEVLEEKNNRRKKMDKTDDVNPTDIYINNIIKKLKHECHLKETDIIQFLDQFETVDLKKAIAILFDNLLFKTIVDMAKDLIEEIKNSVDKYKNVNLVLFAETRLKSQDLWASIIPKYSDYKYKIVKTKDLLNSVIKTKTNQNSYYIFPDDIIGSGEQFINYFKKDLKQFYADIFKVKNKKPNIKFILIAGIGSVESKEKIFKEIPIIDEIRYRKTIREEDKAFSNHIIQDIGLRESLINFLKEKDPKYCFGRNNSQYLVVCQWNVPNNTIGCLWHKTENWTPLFKRISYRKSI